MKNTLLATLFDLMPLLINTNSHAKTYDENSTDRIKNRRIKKHD